MQGLIRFDIVYRLKILIIGIQRKMNLKLAFQRQIQVLSG